MIQFPPEFKIRKVGIGGGTASKLKLPNSIPEIRCMLLACVVVFARHNKLPAQSPVYVELSDRTTENPDSGEMVAGWASPSDNIMRVSVCDDWDETLTIVIHEYSHLLGFPGNHESTISTLTARFKPEIAQIASILLENYQRGAAYVAHAKISYPPDGPDFYNHEQFDQVDGIEWHERYRK